MNSIKLSFKDKLVYSIIISILLGYYLRLNNDKERKELENIFKQILTKYDRKYANYMEILNKEEIFIFQKIVTDNNIKPNRDILDCLFSLFVCICTKIPIFIIGKPGCSKSLSVGLINKAMKGNLSNDSFLKNFPKIITFNVRGTNFNTPEEIKNVFNNARKIIKNNNYEEVMVPLVYYDQIDFADGSPHNPLCILHEELENKLYEENEQVA